MLVQSHAKNKCDRAADVHTSATPRFWPCPARPLLDSFSLKLPWFLGPETKTKVPLRMRRQPRLQALELAGFVAVVAAVGVAVVAAPEFPQLAVALASLISWFVGKLLGTPLTSVTVRAVDSVPPRAAAQIVMSIAESAPARVDQIIASMPPSSNRQAAAAAVAFVESVRPPTIAAPPLELDP